MTLLQKDLIVAVRNATSVIAKAQALKVLALITLEERKKKADSN